MVTYPDDNEAKWAAWLADEVVSDQMGRDTVYYFPRIKLTEE